MNPEDLLTEGGGRVIILSLASLAHFKIPSLPLSFNRLIVMCLCMGFFEFILLGTY